MTSPTQMVPCRALGYMARVGCDGFVGYNWSFYPRPAPLLHRIEQIICPWNLRGFYKGAASDDVMHSVCDPELPEAGKVWGEVVENVDQWQENLLGAV